MKKAAFIITFFVLANSMMAGGPWTQPKGKGYFKFSGWYTLFDKHYTDVGAKDPNVTTGLFNLNGYGEYGFTDRFTGILYAPFYTRNYVYNVVSGTTGETITPGEAVNFLGDADVAVKYSLTKPGKKYPVAISLILGLPLGKTGEGALENLQTGDGEFNQTLQIDAGRGFSLGKKISGYSSTYVGFNHRTKGFSEEIKFGIEAGLGFFEKDLWVIARLGGVESLKNGKTAETNTSTSLFANNSEFFAVTIEAAYYVYKKIGISASVMAPIRGEIIAASPAYSAGIFYDMNK